MSATPAAAMAAQTTTVPLIRGSGTPSPGGSRCGSRCETQAANPTPPSMAMMALLNLLGDNAVQRWFHANPEFQATELLLHEKPIREAGLKAEQQSPVKKTIKPAVLKKAS